MTELGLEILPEDLWPSVRAGCSAADVHLMCSYPKCRCRQMPAAVEAAIRAWVKQSGHGDGEEAKESS